ncbi:unnamed protein product [Brassica oleracea]
MTLMEEDPPWELNDKKGLATRLNVFIWQKCYLRGFGFS